MKIILDGTPAVGCMRVICKECETVLDIGEEDFDITNDPVNTLCFICPNCYTQNNIEIRSIPDRFYLETNLHITCKHDDSDDEDCEDYE